MKKNILFAFLFGALALIGCGSDDDNITNGAPTPRPEGFNNLRDSVGTATRPADWQETPISELDITAPDRIVITAQEVPVEIDPANDLMAAFVNGECRAVTSAIKEGQQVHFTLVVMPKIEENASDIYIELRYFSAKNKRIYIAEPFPFVAGTMEHGTLTSGGHQVKWR